MYQPSDADGNLATQVKEVLSKVVLPGCRKDLVSEKLLENVQRQKDGSWMIVVSARHDQKFLTQDAQIQIQNTLSEVWPHLTFRVILTQSVPAKPLSHVPQRLEGVRYVIAVGSGKGGVGKSTTALNLACSLASLGWRVGVLDGDIYGPSIPKMFQGSEVPLIQSDGGKMIPLRIHDIKVMSMGFLVSEAKPVVWRGPMVHHALRQMLFDVLWAPLDCLVIDLPPGTGDAHLTLTQQIILDGALVISTPQEVALIDARKALAMFRLMQTPILGIVENMSLFHCPHCQHDTPVFQTQGAQQEALRQDVPFLGALPLDPQICAQGENGTPIVVSCPTCPASQVYFQMGESVQKQLLKKN